MNYKETYLEHLQQRGYSQSKINQTRQSIERFKNHTENKKEEEITGEIIERYQEYLNQYIGRTGKELSLNTRRIMLLNLKAYFKYLQEQGKILINPARNMTIPKLRDRLPKDILTEREVEEILNEPNIYQKQGLRNRAMLELFYTSGIRRQELLNLNIYDVDLKRGILKVRQGKNKKDRIVPIGKTAQYYIDKYLREIRKRKDGEALFLKEVGERVTGYVLDNILRQYKEKLAIEKRISCHSFRHACAVHMLRGGADLVVIKRILGHKDLSTTQVYTRLTVLDLKEVHRRSHPRG